MSSEQNDRDLREKFAALRRADAELDPGFDGVMRRERSAGSLAAEDRLGPARRLREAALRALPRRAWATMFAAAVILVLLWLAPPTGLERNGLELDSPPFAHGRWSLPSDALLDLSGLPGQALLGDLPGLTIPSVETSDGAHNQQPQHVPRRRTA